MTFLQYVLGAPPADPAVKAPHSVKEEDEIYPVHTFDDPGRIVTTWTMRFNDVLDEYSLHESLSKLLEIGDWRKAGGRLRQKEKVGLHAD